LKKKSLAARMYRATANAVEPVLPLGLRTPAHYLSRRLTHRLEAEYDAIMSMATPGKTAVDVGANIGVFTYGFLARGSNVVAIEPQPACAAHIRAFDALGLPRSSRKGRLSLHVEALGAETASAVLYVPLRNGRVDDESASLKASDGESLRIEVPVRRLDDYGLDNVDVIKMDVEGRELPALEGAASTIRRWRPSLLIEIEQRHHDEPIAEVFARINDIAGGGYSTSFLDSSHRMRPLHDFDVERDQLALKDNPLSRAYVRNFFFLPHR
jgi:FkbM family methyltransferase